MKSLAPCGAFYWVGDEGASVCAARIFACLLPGGAGALALSRFTVRCSDRVVPAVFCTGGAPLWAGPTFFGSPKKVSKENGMPTFISLKQETSRRVQAREYGVQYLLHGQILEFADFYGAEIRAQDAGAFGGSV